MKVYMITQQDIDSLRDKLKTDPRFGPPNTGVANHEERFLYDAMFRFYLYHVETWIAQITKDKP